jgi:mono/diheme cytochrome c family protein
VTAEGKVLFETMCMHCHGKEGKGDGQLIETGKFPPPPSYSSPALKELPEGKMFHTITYGRNLMGAHASQLSKEERWKVIHYIQELQQL